MKRRKHFVSTKSLCPVFFKTSSKNLGVMRRSGSASRFGCFAPTESAMSTARGRTQIFIFLPFFLFFFFFGGGFFFLST